MRQLILPTNELAVLPPRVGFDCDPMLPILVRFDTQEPLPANESAEKQIADYCGIPWGYFQRMRAEAGTLLSLNVNFWLAWRPTKRVLVVDHGQVTGFHSPKKTAKFPFP